MVPTCQVFAKRAGRGAAEARVSTVRDVREREADPTGGGGAAAAGARSARGHSRAGHQQGHQHSF